MPLSLLETEKKSRVASKPNEERTSSTSRELRSVCIILDTRPLFNVNHVSVTMSYSCFTRASAVGLTRLGTILFITCHEGEGHPAIRVNEHQRATCAALGGQSSIGEKGQHILDGEQRIANAHLDLDARYEVHGVSLHFRDLVNCLRREQPDTVNYAAQSHGRLNTRH